MSTGTNTKARVGLLHPDIYLPSLDDPDLFHEVINERERETGLIMNQKENGVYPLVEVQNSQIWFTSGDPQKDRDGFRTVYETGTLSTGSNTIAHGLSPSTFTFTDFFGVITDGTSHVPIPNGSGGTGDSANILVNATDIVISITAAYNNFSGQIVLEYVKFQ